MSTDPADEPAFVVRDLRALAASGMKFGTVYADPPWRYGNQGTRASTDNHYETMTVDEIAALPVGGLAADRSHLWLWTTNAFLFECPRLFAAWGFEYKSSYVWVKPQMGIGNYLRTSHEFLLLAVRGGLVGAARDVMSWGEFDRGEHSAKPERVRVEVVERVSPGPRLELFARRHAPGWASWGNGIVPSMFDFNIRELG
jgi:N6-adenosine-specific RNA methylase IME4